MNDCLGDLDMATMHCSVLNVSRGVGLFCLCIRTFSSKETTYLPTFSMRRTVSPRMPSLIDVMGGNDKRSMCLCKEFHQIYRHRDIESRALLVGASNCFLCLG